MRSLVDVFKAIQADEVDHAATMKACLDPNVALVSPSIERRVFTGLALLAAVGLAASGDGSMFPTDIAVDSSAAEGFAAGTSAVEAFVAGAAAIASQALEGASFNDLDLEEGAEMMEGSTSWVAGIAGIVGAVKVSIGNKVKQAPDLDEYKSEDPDENKSEDPDENSSEDPDEN
jgi:hypothetical protein